ncbi:MAG: hypothetical protein Q7T41_04600 [Candidatus Saccharibacteria bacterium]|nr:hypothetical protein [Candidatus Saccharibacteria bacterium]
MDKKLKDNSRLVVVALIAAGIVALIASSGGNKNTSTDVKSEPASQASTQTNEAQEAVNSTDNNNNNEVVIGSTPQAGPVEVVKKESVYRSTVRKGDNQTVIARQMVNQFLSDNSKSLSAEQRLYVETVVVDSLPRNNMIYAGQEITVDSSVISGAVDASASLTDVQLARWSAYL